MNVLFGDCLIVCTIIPICTIHSNLSFSMIAAWPFRTHTKTFALGLNNISYKVVCFKNNVAFSCCYATSADGYVD